MNDNHEELDNIVSLNDEFGNKVNFEFLDFVEYEGEEYVVLLPVGDDEDDEGMVMILRIDAIDDDTESYTSVDDEETIQTVYQIFKNNFKDQYDFED